MAAQAAEPRSTDRDAIRVAAREMDQVGIGQAVRDVRVGRRRRVDDHDRRRDGGEPGLGRDALEGPDPVCRGKLAGLYRAAAVGTTQIRMARPSPA